MVPDERPPEEEQQFSVYFSHSGWAADVDLNLFVWKAIAQDCKLLVDHYKDQELPWYVNRIEEYIRRSDLFVAALTFREPRPGEKAPPPRRDP